MRHYFIDDKNLTDSFTEFSYSFGGKKIDFVTNSGLFSPDRVDPETDILLRSLPPLTGSLLDLGCGWGVVGVTLGAVYPISVTMADINPRALACAEKNAAKNNVKAEVVKSDCFENITGKFDTIVLNPPIHAGKQVVFRMYEGAAERLNDGGRFYIVIRKKHGAESSMKKLDELFSTTEQIYKKDGIFVISSGRPRQRIGEN